MHNSRNSLVEAVETVWALHPLEHCELASRLSTTLTADCLNFYTLPVVLACKLEHWLATTYHYVAALVYGLVPIG